MPNDFARALCTVVLASTVLTACDAKQSAPASSSVRTDSAGVEIVTGPAADQPLNMELREVFRIGGNDSGPGSFSSAHTSVVRTDAAGRIYVLDTKQHRVEVFDSLGNHIRFVGQRGGGPGEMQDPAQLFVLDDGTIGVSDYGKRAIVRWAADGSVLPEFALSFFPSDPLRMSGDTLLYVHEDYEQQQNAQVLRIASPRDTVSMSPLTRPTTGMIMFSCIGLNLPPMFTQALVWSGTAERLATSLQVPYVVDVYEQGRLVRSVRRPITTQAPTVEHVNRLHPDGMQIRFNGGACTVPAAELLEKQGVADRLPLVEALQFDRQARLWVQRYGIRDEPRSVDVFDRDGNYSGTLSGRAVPLGFIGNDIALFAEPDDETGVVQIAAYALSPPRESE
jgi:hypothetical protein